jgi:hypothetical protein
MLKKLNVYCNLHPAERVIATGKDPQLSTIIAKGFCVVSNWTPHYLFSADAEIFNFPYWRWR